MPAAPATMSPLRGVHHSSESTFLRCHAANHPFLECASTAPDAEDTVTLDPSEVTSLVAAAEILSGTVPDFKDPPAPRPNSSAVSSSVSSDISELWSDPGGVGGGKGSPPSRKSFFTFFLNSLTA